MSMNVQHPWGREMIFFFLRYWNPSKASYCKLQIQVNTIAECRRQMWGWAWNTIVKKNIATIICSPRWWGAKHSGQLEKTNEALRSRQIALESTIGIVAVYFSGKFSKDQVPVLSFWESVHICKNFLGFIRRSDEHPSYGGAFSLRSSRQMHNGFPLFRNGCRAQILWREITMAEERDF